MAPGTKVGGWPGWFQEPTWPGCAGCGARMEHLLTIADAELDGISWRTWVPLEEQPPGTDVRRDGDRSIATAAGLDLGGGAIELFVCAACPERPHDHRFDR